MYTIIIFTRKDDSTKRYLRNLFPDVDLNRIDFTFLEFRINNSLPRMLFINDERECDIDPGLLDNTGKNYVFFHLSSANRRQHENYIDDNLSNCIKYHDGGKKVAGDHHNEDGYHYQYILDASKEVLKGNLNGYQIAIMKLIQIK